MQKHLVVALATALSVAGLTAGPARADREVVVQPGDNMRIISMRYYGDEDHVWTITRYNHLASPDLIYAGLRLVLPELPADDTSAGSPPDVGGTTPVPAQANGSGPTTSNSSGPPLPPGAPKPPAATHALPVLTGPGSPDSAPSPSAAPSSATDTVPGVAIQSGLATWYGPGFSGSLTYCGDVYDQWDYTAASNTLPCNAVVIVTNQSTGGSVRVRINDRGGFGGALILDLSRAAFESLASDSVGVIPITVSMPAH